MRERLSTQSTLSLSLTLSLLIPGLAVAEPWEDATAQTIGKTAEWSNKVEVADIDGDGLVDILFANGGKYSSPGTAEPNRVFLNKGAGMYAEATEQVFGDKPDLARVIKARDVNGDGIVDIVVGATYQTRSRLYHGLGDGKFVERTKTHLPAIDASVGDLELGDVDDDGDLDIVLADWGATVGKPGGRTMLWLNDGTGSFTDVTQERMPEALVAFSWDLELVDTDNDFDLDILVSCKSCSGSFLFMNDGQGTFTDASETLPQFKNNYEFAPMDLDGDGFLDLVTINDGANLGEHLLLADGKGGFTDATAALWPAEANIGKDDNVVVHLDYDSDGDADFLIGSLNGEDRLLLNDGTGKLSLVTGLFKGAKTPGTLGLALADLNGDGKLDVVQSQGEVASPDKVFFGVDIAPDTAPPVIGAPSGELDEATSEVVVRVRVHDSKSPTMPHDWSAVEVRWTADGGEEAVSPLIWYGEYLWRARIAPPLGASQLEWAACAQDAAGNEACSEPLSLALLPIEPADDGGSADVGPPVVVEEEEEEVDAGPSPAEPGPEPSPDPETGDRADVLLEAEPGSPADTSVTSESADGGCSCRAVGAPANTSGWPLFALCMGLILATLSRPGRHRSGRLGPPG